MKLLSSYKLSLIEKVLDLLWLQWGSFGVSSQNESREDLMIDLEALLLVTLSFGRFDQRLFDEVLDWISIHNRYINLGRLNAIVKKEGFDSVSVLSSLGRFFSQSGSSSKLSKLESKYGQSERKKREQAVEAMFYSVEGRPIPVPGKEDETFKFYGLSRNQIVLRGQSQVFQSYKPQCLQLSLRALFGVSARADVLSYCLLGSPANLKTISDQTYYVWRSVQEVMHDLGHLGVVVFPASKKHRLYTMDKNLFDQVLNIRGLSEMKWVCWPSFMACLERLLIWLWNHSKKDFSLDFLNTEFNLFYEKEMAYRLEKSGFHKEFHQSARRGRDYSVESFFQCLFQLLEELGA